MSAIVSVYKCFGVSALEGGVYCLLEFGATCGLSEAGTVTDEGGGDG